jgi:uncharacterized protein YndB with AHSA1/START domain
VWCSLTTPGGLTLHLEKTLKAPLGDVFAAFVVTETLAKWWGPHGFVTPDVELDAHEGGRYRITMQPPEGDAFHLGGEFRVVDPPRRLVYTFEWEEPDTDDRETVVGLSFFPHEQGTKIVLEQAGFETEARRALHDAGWTDSFERLEAVLGGEHSSIPPRAADPPGAP